MTFCPGESTCTPVATTCMPGVRPDATSTVNSQVVQIATADGNDAVVASGLTPGMQVVATGVHVLSPGQKVMIYQPKTAVAPVSKAQTATNSVAIPAVPAASAAAAASSAK